VRSVLERGGYEVADTDERRARSILDSEPAVRLIITNQPQTFEPLIGLAPILYLASEPDWDLASRIPGMRVLQKPFQTKELLAMVREMISRASGAAGNSAG
jgi:hypothetical protein